MGDEGEQQNHDHRGVEPVEGERQERQLEHVEADIGPELRISHSEVARVPEQQPVLPLRGGRQREHEPEEHRRAVANESEPTAEHLVEPLHVGMHVGREHARREPVREPQVQQGETHEQDQEDAEERHLRNELTPEDIGAAEAVVPEVVEVETGHTAAEHHDEEEDRAERGEDDPTTRAAARRWSREV